MSPSVDSPTVVIGVGGAGIDVLERVHGTVVEEGFDEDEFLFLGVDSRDIRELSGVSGWDQKTTTLSWKERKEWERKFRDYHYLDETDDIPPEEGGVQQDRPLARALIDDVSNISQLIGNLEYSITNFENETQGNTLDIWIVNSLGGGTGSGVLPMMLGLMQWLEQSEFDSNINLHALVSLPQLDLDPEMQFPPTIDSKAVPNAFAALSELRDLVDTTASDDTQVEIDIELDTSEVSLFTFVGEGTAPIQRNHFEAFYLLGIDEDAISADSGTYAREIERLAANTILAHATLSENFPDPANPSLEDRILHTNDIVEYRFPYETVASFVEQKSRYVGLQNDQKALSNLDEQFTSNRDFVNDVVQIRHDSDDVDILRTYCRERVDSIDGDTIQYLDKESVMDRFDENVNVDSDEAENLRNEFDRTRRYIESVSEQHRPEQPGSWRSENETDDDSERRIANDERAPEQAVLEFLFLDTLEERIRELQSRKRRSFEEAVETLWKEVRSELGEEPSNAYRDYNDYEDKWELALKNALSDRIQDLREGGIIRKKKYQERADELDGLREDVTKAKSTLEAYQRVESDVQELKARRRSSLRNLVEWYDEAADNVDSIEQRIREKMERTESEMEDSRDDLSESPSPGKKFATMPIADPDALVSEYFQDSDQDLIDRLDELVTEYDVEGDGAAAPYNEAAKRYLRATVDVDDAESKDILDSDTMYDDLRTLVENLEERVADEGTLQDALILPIVHPDDDWLDVIDQGDFNALIAGGSVSNCTLSDHRGAYGLRGTIRFLLTNPNVSLDDASEYSTLRQWYDDGKLLDILETDADTPEEAVNFAYPELVDFLGQD